MWTGEQLSAESAWTLARLMTNSAGSCVVIFGKADILFRVKASSLRGRTIDEVDEVWNKTLMCGHGRNEDVFHANYIRVDSLRHRSESRQTPDGSKGADATSSTQSIVMAA